MTTHAKSDLDHRVTTSPIAARYIAKVRGLLARYKSANELVRELSKELEETQQAVDELREGVTASRASASGIRSQRYSDPTYEAVARILHRCEERIAAMTRDIEEMLVEQAIVDELIAGLNIHQRGIVRGRCLERRSWAYLSLRHNLSERQLVRRTNEAMVEMAHAYEAMFGDPDAADAAPAASAR